ncbi:hypothetical protein [Hartmannibacter diazotrophicus]|uniref:hypothetical protein n=1 Tax=Hartmannibacter diazotrophicus TaxID=1482074 RepID=UPI0012FE56EA|nr:hypothetical protein [Hartmannibacter diazotrophicus]
MKLCYFTIKPFYFNNLNEISLYFATRYITRQHCPLVKFQQKGIFSDRIAVSEQMSELKITPSRGLWQQNKNGEQEQQLQKKRPLQLFQFPAEGQQVLIAARRSPTTAEHTASNLFGSRKGIFIR